MRSATLKREPKGLRQFLDPVQQAGWMDGSLELADAGQRTESIEHRFRYAERYQKFLRRPQAQEVLAILALYGRRSIPIPRLTERYYWSVSCLPSTSDKPLLRVNASWMELFTVFADGEGLRARFILHLSDFTTNGLPIPERLDEAYLEGCGETPEDISHFFPRGDDMFGVGVRGTDSIRKFLSEDRALRAIRRFNLTHMNRGRNAYQASHCHNLADCFVDD